MLTSWSEAYEILVDVILKFLRVANIKNEDGVFFSRKTLREYFVSSGKLEAFGEFGYRVITSEVELTDESWSEFADIILQLFDIEMLSNEALEFLDFHDPVDNEDIEIGRFGELAILPGNRIKHPDGFCISLSTIHGVKGETHDATLILETKNFIFDISNMIPYLTGELPNEEHPNHSLPPRPHHNRRFRPNQVFMRQLFVGLSRARHLVCLAINRNHVSEADLATLRDLGWEVIFVERE